MRNVKTILLLMFMVCAAACASTTPTTETQFESVYVDGIAYPADEVNIDRPTSVDPSVAGLTVYKGDSKRDVLVKVGSPEKRVQVDGRECWLFWDGMLIEFDKKDIVSRMFLLSTSL